MLTSAPHTLLSTGADKELKEVTTGLLHLIAGAGRGLGTLRRGAAACRGCAAAANMS